VKKVGKRAGNFSWVTLVPESRTEEIKRIVDDMTSE